MPSRTLQKTVTSIVAEVLGVKPVERTFSWLKNTHTQEDFGEYYSCIDRIFHALNGDATAKKGIRSLNPDAYFGGTVNCLFEFDEVQHFSTARLRTLEMYPSTVKIAFDIEHYKHLCQMHQVRANKCYQHKRSPDFDFAGGRTAQRAYLDCFRDFLPGLYDLNPTLRISEFEIAGLNLSEPDSHRIIRTIVEKKLTSVDRDIGRTAPVQ